MSLAEVSRRDVSNTIRPGSLVTYCGVVCKVASVFRGEAEVTTLTGTLIDYFPVSALHLIPPEDGKPTLADVRTAKQIVQRRTNGV